jgi:hypothetical protein
VIVCVIIIVEVTFVCVVIINYVVVKLILSFIYALDISRVTSIYKAAYVSI